MYSYDYYTDSEGGSRKVSRAPSKQVSSAAAPRAAPTCNDYYYTESEGGSRKVSRAPSKQASSPAAAPPSRPKTEHKSLSQCRSLSSSLTRALSGGGKRADSRVSWGGASSALSPEGSAAPPLDV